MQQQARRSSRLRSIRRWPTREDGREMEEAEEKEEEEAEEQEEEDEGYLSDHLQWRPVTNLFLS